MTTAPQPRCFSPGFLELEREEPMRRFYDREHHPLSTDGMVIYPQDLPHHLQAAEEENARLGYQHAVVDIHPNQETLDNGVPVSEGMIRVTIGGGWLTVGNPDLGPYWQTYYHIKRVDQQLAAARRLASMLRRPFQF